jgi:hypothetical protein
MNNAEDEDPDPARLIWETQALNLTVLEHFKN